MNHKTVLRGVTQRGSQLLITRRGERFHVELRGLGYDVLPTLIETRKEGHKGFEISNRTTSRILS